MRVALVVPERRDPAHAAVLRGLGAALRARGHRVFCMSAGERHAGGRLARFRPDIVHVHGFSRRWARLSTLRVPAGARLVLTDQGASPSLVDDRTAMAALAKRAQVRTAAINGAEPGLPTRARSGPDLLTVGRIAAYKGLDVLALAVAGLADAGRPLRWLAVGPDQTGGRFRRFLNRLGLEENVRLTGRLPAGRVRALMASCRVFVQPSRAEGLPMALLEAMAAGAPCVAADAGGCREALGRAGLAVPSGDPRALRRALSAFLNDAALRRRKGAAARRRSERFLWPTVARRWERLYAGTLVKVLTPADRSHLDSGAESAYTWRRCATR